MGVKYRLANHDRSDFLHPKNCQALQREQRWRTRENDMAEMEYVSNARFEQYQKHVDQRFDLTSKMINERLDFCLDNLKRELKREIVYSAQKRVMSTVTYLGIGVIIAVAILAM